MTVTAEQVEQEIALISTGYSGGPAISFGENWRIILPNYVFEAWFAPPSIQHASNRYGEYISALRKWHNELKAKETVTTKQIDTLIQAAVYGITPSYLIFQLPEWQGKWPSSTPKYISTGFCAWRDDGTTKAMDPIINDLKRWRAEITGEVVVTPIQGLYSINEVVESLDQCNNELEIALSCVHHYKHNKQVKEQIDRLSRNYVALATRMAVEDRPEPEFKVGDLVKTIGLTIEEKDDGWYKLPDSPPWRIEAIKWANHRWTYGLLENQPRYLFKPAEALRKV